MSDHKEPSPTVRGLNKSAQGTVFALMVLAVLLAVFLPAQLLTKFTGYTDPGGGNPVFKIHFYSYALALAFVFVLACRGPISVLSDQIAKQFGVVQFGFVVGICAAILVIRHGVGSLGYMVDTLLVAPLAIVLTGYLTPERQYKLAALIVWVVLLNAAVAIVERMLGMHLMDIIPGKGDVYFRSTAFFGEPLANALVTSAVMFVILGMQWSARRKTIALLVCFAALLSFGARGALLITSILIVTAVLSVGVISLFKGRLRLSTLAFAPWVLTLGLATIVVLMFATPLGERIVSTAYFDENAEERLDAYRVFDYLSDREILSGISAAKVNRIIATDYNIQIIENFWVILLLMLGAIMFVFFLISLIWFCYSLAARGEVLGFIAVAGFFLVASTNNSLATKSPALMLFVLAMAGCTRVFRDPKPIPKPVHYVVPRHNGLWT